MYGSIISMGQTWMITDNDSTMKNPEEMSSGKNIPVHAAIAANAPPSAKDPILPINTDALYLLWRRNPTQDPAIEAPNIARSGLEYLQITNLSKKVIVLSNNSFYIVLKMTIFRVMIRKQSW